MRSTTKRTIRAGYYSVEEDALLVSAWLNMQVNERKPFWSRVADFFHKHKKFKSSRTESSLEYCWLRIQTSTNFFCECLSLTKMKAKNEGGADEQDKIFQARLLYRQLYKTSFQFEHCWSLLRHHPKWLEEERKPKMYRLPTDVASSSPTTPETLMNLREGDVSHDNYVDSETGKDQLNKRKREDNYVDLETPLDFKAEMYLGDDNVAFLQESAEEKKQVLNEKKADLDEKIYLQEPARLVYEQEKLRMEQLKEEERIMSIDTNGMLPLQAEYYKRRQLKILVKMIES